MVAAIAAAPHAPSAAVQCNLWHATRICICISAWLSPSTVASLHLISHVIYCCPNLSRAVPDANVGAKAAGIDK